MSAPKQIITTFFLAFVLCTYNINNVIIVINFVLNQETIAKTLCVQKEDQQGCNGKCQLEKQLNKNISPKNNAPAQQNSKLTLVEYNYIQPTNILYLSKPILSIRKKKINKKAYNLQSIFIAIETPPPNLS